MNIKDCHIGNGIVNTLSKREWTVIAVNGSKESYGSSPHVIASLDSSIDGAMAVQATFDEKALRREFKESEVSE